MSDEEEVTADDLIRYLSDPDLLAEYGYQVTPKGAMALLFMSKLGMSAEAAEKLSQELEDIVFKAGWIYVHESQIDIGGAHG